MKKRFSSQCPCGDYEFTVNYSSLTGVSQGRIEFCPFCSAELDVDEDTDDEEDEDYDDE